MYAHEFVSPYKNVRSIFVFVIIGYLQKLVVSFYRISIPMVNSSPVANY
ncbi:hypothetical protein HMPREF9554_02377 [Treponema phagedenis F0421]|nr:hypothetical protein HMPREF9554_02377 [Treponema phagedenis F0421]